MPLSIWIQVSIGTAALTVGWQRAAMEVAVSYGELVRVAFDTHRPALLTAMALELPQTLEAERALWKALAQHLYRRAADNPEMLLFKEADGPGGPSGFGALAGARGARRRPIIRLEAPYRAENC